MFKSIVAILFSVLFVVTISVPTIATLIDSEYDVSILLDTNEEEEKESNESSKDVEVKIIQLLQSEFNSLSKCTNLTLGFYSNIYSSTHSELLSPPPEFS